MCAFDWSAVAVGSGRLHELPARRRAAVTDGWTPACTCGSAPAPARRSRWCWVSCDAQHLIGSVPWRRFRSRQGQAHPSGSYWAATTGGHLVHESRLELARLLLADFDAGVVDIYAQPYRLATRIAGRQRRHVPDFLLLSTTGVVTVVNVKPAQCLTDPRVAEALDWPRELFTGHGWRFEVWSGCDPVVLDNVRVSGRLPSPGDRHRRGGGPSRPGGGGR